MKAFPRQITFNNGISQGKWIDDGMDLRDYFAAKAMQAMLAWEDAGNFNVSKEAYMMADAMMEARK
jgi:uncharacterized protein YeaC (DUF1315 family)